MSEVYYATDLNLERDVVLKCLQPYQDPRRIVDEQKALLQVTSKHVVRLLDIVYHPSAHGSQTYLVLECIAGSDLKECGHDVSLDYLKILWQIATGLQEIHNFDVIHRDIKPSNIRVDLDGVVKLFDFGLAREDGVNNKTQGRVGTPLYMAPELRSDKTVYFSTSADVYSFGVMAMTLLKPKLPDWCMGNLGQPVPYDAVENHAPELQPTVKEVLQKCLAGKADTRPTMADVIAVLEKIILHDKHSAQLVLAGNTIDIDKSKRTSSPRVFSKATEETISGIKIVYDGADFEVTESSGGVRMNNTVLVPGMKLTASAILEFPSGQNKPYYATFNVSQPEVFV